MKAVSIVLQPRLDFGANVIRRVVLNQEDFLVTVASCQAAEKPGIGLAIEHLLALHEVSARAAQVHGTKDFLGVALAGRRNARLTSAPGPSLIQRGVLAKAGLIGKEERGAKVSGFFLAWDRCSAASDPGAPDRPWPEVCADVGRKSPNPGATCAHGQDDNRPDTLLGSPGRSWARSIPPRQSRRRRVRYPGCRITPVVAGQPTDWDDPIDDLPATLSSHTPRTAPTKGKPWSGGLRVAARSRRYCVAGHSAALRGFAWQHERLRPSRLPSSKPIVLEPSWRLTASIEHACHTHSTHNPLCLRSAEH